MFIGKKKFDRVVDNINKAFNSQNKELMKLRSGYKSVRAENNLLKMSHMKMIRTMFLQDKKIINLVEIVRLLTSDKDRDLVIATAKDGTELSVGDFLDAEDLFPTVEEKEEDFNIATFIKQV